jgi:hypothetical protein
VANARARSADRDRGSEASRQRGGAAEAHRGREAEALREARAGNQAGTNCVRIRMTASRATSRTTRFGLLIVAVIHIVTAATLSFTHGHVPSDAVVSVSSASEDGDGGSRSAHGDVCVICQAFGSAHVTPAAAKTFTEPVHAAVRAVDDSVVLPSVQTYSSASPLGPPRA